MTTYRGEPQVLATAPASHQPQQGKSVDFTIAFISRSLPLRNHSYLYNVNAPITKYEKLLTVRKHKYIKQIN